ncbi:MAG: hypothetical protein IKK18_05745 [Clostridia bacterium]|nr:hypothetical protein [Clostridia bacterium]
MSRGPRMEKPIKQFIEDCLTVNLVLKNGHRAEKTATDLMNIVKVYMLLTMRKPLVQDMIFEKHLSSGLGEMGLAKTSPKKLKDLTLCYLHFTDLGLAYQKVYQEEVKDKGQSWLNFSVKILKDNHYYQDLLEKVEDYKGCLADAPVVSHRVSQELPKKEVPIIYEGSVSELQDKADSLFKELLSVCASMEKKSNDMIVENGMVNSTKQSAVYDFMMASHRKYFQGAASNESKLRETVLRTQQGFNDAFVVMGLIEGLYK